MGTSCVQPGQRPHESPGVASPPLLRARFSKSIFDAEPRWPRGQAPRRSSMPGRDLRALGLCFHRQKLGCEFRVDFRTWKETSHARWLQDHEPLCTRCPCAQLILSHSRATARDAGAEGFFWNIHVTPRLPAGAVLRAQVLRPVSVSPKWPFIRHRSEGGGCP